MHYFTEIPFMKIKFKCRLIYGISLIQYIIARFFYLWNGMQQLNFVMPCWIFPLCILMFTVFMYPICFLILILWVQKSLLLSLSLYSCYNPSKFNTITNTFCKFNQFSNLKCVSLTQIRLSFCFLILLRIEKFLKYHLYLML